MTAPGRDSCLAESAGSRAAGRGARYNLGMDRGRAARWAWAGLALLALVPACGGGRTARGESASSSSSAVAGPTTPGAAPSTAEWTTYGGGPARTSADTTEPPLFGSPVEAWTSPALDGAVYGQPLVFGGQVLVATERDTVYALSARTGEVSWSLHLAEPAAAGALPCGDIAPTVGVTSTMVVDPATGTLFVSAETSGGGGVGHELDAVDLATHAVRFRVPLDRPGWSAPAQLQRAALALDGGLVLVAFGGNYGDCGKYHGWVMGVPTSGRGPVVTYQVPTANEGAIWAPPGPAVGSSGDVFVATGNGSAGPGEAFDHGNSVIELSPRLVEQQFFAPTTWARDSSSDADLGSTSPVLLGDGGLFQVGKQGTGFTVHTAALGGIGGQVASIPLCDSRGSTAFAALDLYVVCPDSGRIVEVAVDRNDGLHLGWSWTSPTGGASSPTVARGAVWTVDPGASMLYGVDPATGATRFSLPLHTGTPAHFAAPSAGEGLVVVAGSRSVEAFR